MVTKKVLVVNKLGLHARAAAKLVNLASQFSSELSLKKHDYIVNGKSIMGVMLLAASKGSEIEILSEGQDEQALLDAIVRLIEDGFDEE